MTNMPDAVAEALEAKVDKGYKKLAAALQELKNDLAQYGLMGEVTITLQVKVFDRGSSALKGEIERRSTYGFKRAL